MYRFIFYRIYDWGRRVHGLGDLPEYNAILGLSMLATMNVFSLAMAVELASGRAASRGDAKYVAVALWLAFLVLHFMYLLRGGRVEQIREEFEDQPSIGAAGAVAWAYPVVSLVLFFSLLLVRW
jgi:hypothetical protein